MARKKPPSTQLVKASPKEQRNRKGQFVSGHVGLGGRPPREIEAAFLQGLHCRISVDDWNKIIDVAIAAAKGNDRYARDWLGRYALPPRDAQNMLAQNVQAEDSRPIEIINYEAMPSREQLEVMEEAGCPWIGAPEVGSGSRVKQELTEKDGYLIEHDVP